MLAKLLKYEFKATSRLLGILSLAALGVGVLGAALMRYTMRSVMDASPSGNEMVDAIVGTMLVFSFLALFAYIVGTEIYVFIRFYKSRFTDEGYLTFTLPVQGWQIFLSSAINIAVWTIIAGLVMALAGGMIFYFGMGETGIIEEMQDFYLETEAPSEIYQLGIGKIVSSIVSFLHGIILPMTCITIGAVLAKKHKILTAIGIYYGFSVVSSILSTVFMVFDVLNNPDTMLELGSGIMTTTQFVVCIGGFFLSTYLMNRKLNLP